MKLKILFTSISILFFLSNIIAQISHGGSPLSFEHFGLKSISVFNTPLYNYQQMIKEDEETSGKVKPFRFGKTHNVSLSPDNSGVWQNLATGKKVWRLKIRSENAFAIGLLFKDFYLNEGVRFFMYSADKSIVKGAFTSLNNKASRVFSTLPLAGDELIVELNIPQGVEYGKFEISGIVHDYKNAFGKGSDTFKASGSCNVNINCPEGDDWQKVKRSIVKYTYGSYQCTGVIINNIIQDATPYLLTAEHCISSSSVAAGALFIFNYESELCSGTTGPTSQTISSASLVATGENLDFSLLKLSIEPPVDYNVYYAGWNRSTNPASNTVCIHHPSRDIKKISLDYDPPTTGNYGSGYVSNSHWWIHEWDVGTTEGGSSGSPIFDENHRIVGDLTGGDASCSYNYNDYYAKFDMSWDYYPEASQQLKAWLDPDNTGAITLDGFDPNEPVKEIDMKITSITNPSGSYCISNQVVPSIIIQNKGISDFTSVTIKSQINDQTVSTQNWTGNLKTDGSETIILNPILLPAGTGTYTVTAIAPNGILDNNPISTMVSNFDGQELIENLLIDGDQEICLNSKSGVYFTNESGEEYSWNIQDGEIISREDTERISVEWNEWGQRELNLTLTNLCGEYSSETFVVSPVEQSLILEISPSNTITSWLVINERGDTIAEGKVPASEEITRVSICLNSDSYSFVIFSDDPCNTCHYELSNTATSSVVSEGNYSSTQNADNIELQATNGYASFNVYPNPANNIINLEANFIGVYDNAVYSIYNLSGAMVTPENPLNGRTAIDITELRKGYYIIKIISDYGEFEQKFLKP